jgi:hypothetical protein
MDDWTLRLMLDDLKYLNRLNKHSFAELLFPKAVESYLDVKWLSFREHTIQFLWSCDQERLVRIVDYINEQKGDDQ